MACSGCGRLDPTPGRVYEFEMIKFVDMTSALRAADPSAPPTCAFLNTETGRFCEHGGTGEHLFTSRVDVLQHGHPGGVTVPDGFFESATTVPWVQVPTLALARDPDGDLVVKHPRGSLQWVYLSGRGGGESAVWWPVGRPDWTPNNGTPYEVVATGLRGNESVDELQVLAGMAP